MTRGPCGHEGVMTLVIAVHMSQTCDQQHLTISKMAANWQDGVHNINQIIHAE